MGFKVWGLGFRQETGAGLRAWGFGFLALRLDLPRPQRLLSSDAVLRGPEGLSLQKSEILEELPWVAWGGESSRQNLHQRVFFRASGFRVNGPCFYEDSAFSLLTMWKRIGCRSKRSSYT